MKNALLKNPLETTQKTKKRKPVIAEKITVEKTDEPERKNFWDFCGAMKNAPLGGTGDIKYDCIMEKYAGTRGITR